MLSKAVRSVVVCCSMRSSMALTVIGQRVEFVARAVDAQPLREIAVHDGLAGDGVVAHAPRGAARVGRAQQPHAQRGQADAPQRREPEAAQHALPLAGVGADQQPVAVRQPLDARLDRMQHLDVALARRDVELDHLGRRWSRHARRAATRRDCRPPAGSARRPAGTPRRCGPSCRRAGAAWRPRGPRRRAAGRRPGPRPRRAPPRRSRAPARCASVDRRWPAAALVSTVTSAV